MILEQHWTVLWWQNARRRRRLFDTEDKARAFAAGHELEVDPETITIREFVDHIYLPLRRLGDGSDAKSGKPLSLLTLAVYSSALRAHAFPVIGEERLCDLTTDRLRAVLTTARTQLEADGRAEHSIESDLYHLWSLLGSITRLASRLGYCHVSLPDRAVTFPRSEATGPAA